MAFTWNPDDKSANIVLSNYNRTATNTVNTWQAVRAAEYKPSGKWYWEVTVDYSASAGHIMIGIGTSSEVLTYPGDTVQGYGYYGTGVTYHSSSTAYGDSYGTGDVIGVALDIDSGKIWWSKNGVWQGSGDPAAGTNEAYSGLSGNFYAMAGIYASTEAVTANFTQASLSYPPPSGFGILGYAAYFSGHVYEETSANPVSRVVYCYRRDTGALMDSTTSSGDGYYYLETTHSGDHFIVALDNAAGTQYNLAALDWMVPTTVS